MDWPRRKKACVRKAKGSEERSSENNGPVIAAAAKLLAEEELKEVFKWCNLPTRCRLRRVSRYWKGIVSFTEVNQVVFVNSSCLAVSQTVRKNPGRSTKVRPTAAASTCKLGWYQRVTSKASHDSLNLADHQRGGLMGDHVRVLIYEDYGDIRTRPCGCEEPVPTCNYYLILRSIGLYCPNVQHIVLLCVHLGFQWFEMLWFTRRCQWFSDTSPVGFPNLTTLTLVSCLLDCCEWIDFDRTDLLGFELKIPHLTVDWSTNKETAFVDWSPFIWTDPTAQRKWVAKYATKLPEKWKEFMNDVVFGDGISAQNLHWILRGETDNPRNEYDLRTMDYSTAPLTVILELAAFIEQELPAALAHRPKCQPSDVVVYRKFVDRPDPYPDV